MTAAMSGVSAADARATMIGPVGRTVIDNIERLRKAQGLSFRDLAIRMTEAGRPVGDTVLHRQSTGKRRIDADDLMAFAKVFRVSPMELLGVPGDEKLRSAARPDHGQLLTTEALAAYLGDVSTRTLEDWRRLGLGPDFVPISPKLVRYRPQAVDRWLDSLERRDRAGTSETQGMTT